MGINGIDMGITSVPREAAPKTTRKTGETGSDVAKLDAPRMETAQTGQEAARNESRIVPEAVQPEAERQTKAIFALDEDKNVVIQVIDEEGEVVRQMPPEEFLEATKSLRELAVNMFHIEG